MLYDPVTFVHSCRGIAECTAESFTRASVADLMEFAIHHRFLSRSVLARTWPDYDPKPPNYQIVRLADGSLSDVLPAHYYNRSVALTKAESVLAPRAAHGSEFFVLTVPHADVLRSGAIRRMVDVDTLTRDYCREYALDVQHSLESQYIHTHCITSRFPESDQFVWTVYHTYQWSRELHTQTALVGFVRRCPAVLVDNVDLTRIWRAVAHDPVTMKPSDAFRTRDADLFCR